MFFHVVDIHQNPIPPIEIPQQDDVESPNFDPSISIEDFIERLFDEPSYVDNLLMRLYRMYYGTNPMDGFEINSRGYETGDGNSIPEILLILEVYPDAFKPLGITRQNIYAFLMKTMYEPDSGFFKEIINGDPGNDGNYDLLDVGKQLEIAISLLSDQDDIKIPYEIIKNSLTVNRSTNKKGDEVVVALPHSIGDPRELEVVDKNRVLVKVSDISKAIDAIYALPPDLQRGFSKELDSLNNLMQNIFHLAENNNNGIIHYVEINTGDGSVHNSLDKEFPSSIEFNDLSPDELLYVVNMFGVDLFRSDQEKYQFLFSIRERIKADLEKNSGLLSSKGFVLLRTYVGLAQVPTQHGFIPSPSDVEYPFPPRPPFGGTP